MPRTTNRQKRAKELIYGFLNYLKFHTKRAALRHRRQRRFLRRIAPINPYAPIDFAVELEALDSEPTSSSGSTGTNETSAHLGAAGFSEIFGSSDSDSDASGDSLFSSTTSESGSDLSSAGESEDEGEDISQNRGQNRG
jgi:hypothetical protein